MAQPLKDLPITSVISSNPYLDFARALALFYSAPKPEPGIHPLAFVHPTARSAKTLRLVHSPTSDATSRFGRNAVLHPHVVIYEGAANRRRFLAHAHASCGNSAGSAIA